MAGQSGVEDKTQMDASVCFTPEDLTALEQDRKRPGCACEMTRINRTGFCFDGLAVECWDGRWTCPDGRELVGAITVEDSQGQARCCKLPDMP